MVAFFVYLLFVVCIVVVVSCRLFDFLFVCYWVNMVIVTNC